MSSIAADGMTRLRREPYPTKSNAQEMLWIPHHYLTRPANGVWVMQGRCAVLSMAIDLALEEERNLSFILIISDLILLLKDACGKQT